MLRFVDILKLSLEVVCEPYVWRVGCVQCIRTIGEKQLPPSELQKTHVTGAPTNVDCDDPAHTWFIQACLMRPNVYKPNHRLARWPEWGFGGKLIVSPYTAHGELVKKFLTAALSYGEHEVREAFLYRGQRIFGPHIDVEALLEIADRTEVRE